MPFSILKNLSWFSSLQCLESLYPAQTVVFLCSTSVLGGSSFFLEKTYETHIVSKRVCRGFWSRRL